MYPLTASSLIFSAAELVTYAYRAATFLRLLISEDTVVYFSYLNDNMAGNSGFLLFKNYFSSLL